MVVIAVQGESVLVTESFDQATTERLEQELPKTKPSQISERDQQMLVAIIERSSKLYKKTLDQIAGDLDLA